MLNFFLQSKPLYYSEIDYTRMPKVYAKIHSSFDTPKIIHLIGTNAKGTTGRFLATALVSLGFKTGHYTSPHIMEFNERIWLNGENAKDEALQDAHKKLQTLLSQEESDALSYFEYTTLLAMLFFKGCDYVVLEAGLGGEHDATAVFPKMLTLVTPIGYDHEAFLGETIEEIAGTKLRAIQKCAIVAEQKFEEVHGIAREIATLQGAELYRVDDFLDEDDRRKIEEISKNLSLFPYLKENLKLSISALKHLKLVYKVEDFNNSRLFARASKMGENVLIDVGHNPLAASCLVDSLMGEKYILVYNTYKDKNYREILRILKPILWHVEIITIEGERVEKEEILQQTLEALEIEHRRFTQIHAKNNYLVFGSFSVVEAFLVKSKSKD